MLTDLLLDSTMPHSVDMETSMIASCLLGNPEAVEHLDPEDFYKTAHQKIFAAVQDLTRKKITPDLPTVANALIGESSLDEIGGAVYLAQIISEAPVPSNVKHYAKIIKDKAALRTIIIQAHDITKACLESSATAETIISEAQKRLLSIDFEASKNSVASYHNLSEGAADRYQELYKRKDSLSGIASGYEFLDMLLCGFQPSDLIILAGRPSMGKTALALNIAGNIGKQDIPVAIFSLEMSKQQLFDRQVAMESGVNLQKFRSGRFEKPDWEALNEAQGRIDRWPIHIDDDAALNYLEIGRRIHRYRRQFGIEIAFIDHLQLVKGDKSPSRDREIGSITAGLKATAKQVKIPIILLSQLNRNLEERSNPKKRPRLSDLRDSGNIEQDADVVMFLYRPAVYKDVHENPFQGQAELNVAKQRNGPTGMIKLMWHERTTRFSNPETRCRQGDG